MRTIEEIHYLERNLSQLPELERIRLAQQVQNELLTSQFNPDTKQPLVDLGLNLRRFNSAEQAKLNPPDDPIKQVLTDSERAVLEEVSEDDLDGVQERLTRLKSDLYSIDQTVEPDRYKDYQSQLKVLHLRQAQLQAEGRDRSGAADLEAAMKKPGYQYASRDIGRDQLKRVQQMQNDHANGIYRPSSEYGL